jgi:hypothetical protein
MSADQPGAFVCIFAPEILGEGRAPEPPQRVVAKAAETAAGPS